MNRNTNVQYITSFVSETVYVCISIYKYFYFHFHKFTFLFTNPIITCLVCRWLLVLCILFSPPKTYLYIFFTPILCDVMFKMWCHKSTPEEGGTKWKLNKQAGDMKGHESRTKVLMCVLDCLLNSSLYWAHMTVESAGSDCYLITNCTLLQVQWASVAPEPNIIIIIIIINNNKKQKKEKDFTAGLGLGFDERTHHGCIKGAWVQVTDQVCYTFT